MLSLGLLLAVIPLALAQFPFPPSGYVFRIGETQTIKWHTTLPNFTIGFWQQALAGNSASLGPILIRVSKSFVARAVRCCITRANRVPESTNGPAITQFDWVVQIYGFDLRTSNIFFFWLIQGDAMQQGNQSAPGFSSAIFNITDQGSPSGSVSSQPTTKSQTSQTSTSSSAVTLGLGANPGPPSGSGSGQSEGLSTGSLTGIAVGASLVGIAFISGAVYWIRKSRKKRKELEAQLAKQTARLNQYANEQATLGKQVVASTTPMGKGNNGNVGPVELG
jgi:hypothetical protein